MFGDDMFPEQTTPMEISRPATPEGYHSFYSTDHVPHGRCTWPLPQPQPVTDPVDPFERWRNTSERAERISLDVPRITTQVLGLGLLDRFIRGWPELRLDTIFHMFDHSGEYVGWRPKVPTWHYKGDI